MNESLSVATISTQSDVTNRNTEINEKEECMVIQEDTVEDISAQHNADTNRGIIDLTSDQHIFPPILHPKGFMHASIHHVNRNVNADACCIVGMTNIDPTYHINLSDKKERGEQGKDTKKKSR